MVLAANQSGNVNYTAAPEVTTTFTVAQSAQTINPFTPVPNQTFSNGATVTITPPTASSSLPVTVTVKSGPATISGNTVTLTGAGTVMLAANQSGNASYTAAAEVTTTFTVAQSVQSITFTQPDAQTFVPNGTFALSASAPGGAVTFTSSNTNVISVSGSRATIRGAGTAMITARAKDKSAPIMTRTVTVNKAVQSISFTQPAAQTFVPNGTFALSATAPGGAVAFTSSNSNVISVSGSRATIRGAGTAVITANQAGNANYTEATGVTRTVTVNKAPQTISFRQPATQTYAPNRTFVLSGRATGGTVTFTSSNTNVISIDGSTATVMGAERVIITANQAGNESYAVATAVTRTVTVNKARQTISFPQPAAQTFLLNGTFELTGSAPGGAVSFTTSNRNILSISGTTATMKAKGKVNVTASQSGNTNYNAASNVVRTIVIR